MFRQISSVPFLQLDNDALHPEINPVKAVPELDDIIITKDTVGHDQQFFNC